MYERHEYHEYLDKYRSHIENYEDLQRKIHGEMITNSLDSWIHEFLKTHLRNQWVPGLINKNAEATRTLSNMMKHQIPTIGNLLKTLESLKIDLEACSDFSARGFDKRLHPKSKVILTNN